METHKTKEDNIGKILEYWYTLDFLGQDKFPKVDEPDEKGGFSKRGNFNGKSGTDDDVKICRRCLKFDNTEIIQKVKEDAERWSKDAVYYGNEKGEGFI